MSKKILHIGRAGNFLSPLIDLVKETFSFDEHTFLLTSGMDRVKPYKNVKVYQHTRGQRIKYYKSVLIKMHRADKVILHGLFDINLVFILFCAPWLLKKCYWVIWGGDLYAHQFGIKNRRWKRNEFLRSFVIKRIGHLVSYIKGDVELARKWYGAKGEYHECIMYLSNVYKELDIPASSSQVTNIQVGNSADPSNNHIEALEKLLPYKDDDICIYVPLSYGSQEHAKKVITQGEKWFGDKFIPLTNFMPFKEYLKFLGNIDIAIFNHKRQQAMGNTITLLGLGKKVYMRCDVSQWDLFQGLGVDVSDIAQLESSIFESSGQSSLENGVIIKRYFSKENLVKQLQGYLT